MARLRTQREMAMTTQTIDATRTGEPREIATTLLRLGATSYGGPAIMGLMQHELQERRKWVSKERFLEGLAVANMVPGATATQLGRSEEHTSELQSQSNLVCRLLLEKKKKKKKQVNE